MPVPTIPSTRTFLGSQAEEPAVHGDTDMRQPIAHTSAPLPTVRTRALGGRRVRTARGAAVVTDAGAARPAAPLLVCPPAAAGDPPLLLVSLARTARSCAALRNTPFVVNVLAEDQLDLAL